MRSCWSLEGCMHASYRFVLAWVILSLFEFLHAAPSLFLFFLSANSCQSVAVLMAWRQTSLSLAFFQAVRTPKFWNWTSSCTVLTRLSLDVRPVSSSQLEVEVQRLDMVMFFRWCWTERARWPKNRKQWDMTTSKTGEQETTLWTVSFVVCLVYGIYRMFS